MIRRPAVHGLLVLVACGSASAQLESVFPGAHVPIKPPDTYEQKLLRAADMDADGRADLVLVSASLLTGANLIEVLRGLPEGGFAPPILSPVAGNKTLVAMTTGDLDGDAWLDVAAATFNQRIVVAHGQGDGSLIESYEYFSGNGQPVAVAIADVNQDGLADVVSATNTTPGWINVNLAAVGGGYLATQAWTAGIRVQSMAVTDLDADGWPDVLACRFTADTLSVLHDDDAGGLLAPQLLAAAPRPQCILAGPLDGDGDMDALLIAEGGAFPSPGVVQPWLGDGAGALVPAASATAGLNASGGELGDLDGDGDLDAVVSAGGPDNINVLLNDGAAHFSVTPLQLGFGVPTALADASGDGLLDMLFITSPAAVGVIPALAPGVFPNGDSSFNSGEIPQGLDIGLVDGDELPDVVVSWTNSSPGMATLLDSPTGLQTTLIVSPGYTTCPTLRVGDLDGDGFADVACSPNPIWPPRIQFGHGLGTGVFAPPQQVSWTGTDTIAQELTLGDIDGDGWRDVVGMSWAQNNTLLTFLNPGNGTVSFPAPILLDLGPSANSVQLGDVDGDGFDDAVLNRPAPSGGTDVLMVLPGSPSGVLLPGPTSDMPPAEWNPAALALADMDLDGELDAIVAEEGYPAELALAPGDGAGHFQFSEWEPGLLYAVALKVADVNGDGWPDVVHGPGAGNDAVTLRLGDQKGGLLPPQTTGAPSDTQNLWLGDFNHDGRPDLLVRTAPGVSPMPSRVGFLPNIAAPFTWKDLGFALAGASGEPRLVGTGELLPGTPGFLRLSQANPSAPAVLFIAPTAIPTPFKGGTLVPLPPLAAFAFFLDADGSVELAWNSWPSNDPGQSWYFQFGIQDGGGPHGAALSNAISGTEP